jgi:hypothetical protein
MAKPVARPLSKGDAKYNDGGFLTAFEALAKWKPYLPPGYQALAYPDSQNLFAQGRGAIYPAGSWDIGVFRQMNPKLDFGAFKPYAIEGKTEAIIDDHPDIALGSMRPAKRGCANVIYRGSLRRTRAAMPTLCWLFCPNVNTRSTIRWRRSS